MKTVLPENLLLKKIPQQMMLVIICIMIQNIITKINYQLLKRKKVQVKTENLYLNLTKKNKKIRLLNSNNFNSNSN